MATLFTVLRSGGRYDPVWVTRMARGARRHITGLDRIVCLTDFDGPIDGVETVGFRHHWPKWWSKFEVFRPELADEVNILCDLDTLFQSCADPLVSGAEPVAMEDHFLAGRVSTALMRWSRDEFAFLFQEFERSADQWMQPGSCGSVPNYVHGDQVVVDHLLRRQGRLPKFIQAEYPGLLDFYDENGNNEGPILIFIGDSKPDNANPTVRRAWTNNG